MIMVLATFMITGCGKSANTKSDNAKFMKEYEGLNNTKAPYGDNEDYREISISEDNPFVYSSAKEIVNMIDNKETFYVYFGSAHCPWCRSVIEQAIKTANKNNIKKIYYVNIWKPKKVKDGTDEYYKLLDKFNDLLEDYTLTTEDNKKISVGEKRIFAPDFIYVEKGKAKKITTGISKKQKKYNAKLTSEILEDEDKLFDKFFKR